MTTQTLYHVTDASNKASIQEQGLLADDLKNLVFLAGSQAEAERVGEIYNTIDDPVVFEVEVLAHKVMNDPEPHGDIDSYAYRGDIPAHDVTVVSE